MMTSASSASTRERTTRRALVASVFLASAVLRLAAVDRPLNIDEAFWIQRGGVFVSALASEDLFATYTRPHPGVTTMWLVGHSNVAWCTLAQEGTWTSCAQRLADDPLPPLWAYVVPRCVQALFTSALLALMAFLAVQFLGFWPAALGCAFLAFEPFFLAYQRFITSDALATDLSAVAVLWFLLHLREGGRRRLVLSGLAFGLALATKLPVVLLAAPLLILVAVVEGGGWRGFSPRGLRGRALELTLWATIALAVVVAIWPALWVRPVGVGRQLLADLHRETRLHSFRSDDPGAAFYARVLAWRFSPLLQAGALGHGAIALVELLASRPAPAGDRGFGRARAAAARPPSGGRGRGRGPVSPARRAPARASRRRRLGPGGRWLGRARVAAGAGRLRSCGRRSGAACPARALPCRMA